MQYEKQVRDLDVIFISYDEENKEENYKNLLSICPKAKRVDGVTGFDKAHKQAASLSSTDRFITVDGDTIVDPSFFNMTLRFDYDKYHNHTFSWASKNRVNGLVYGNGSLKCWNRKTTLSMNSHEDTDNTSSSIDFYWAIPYLSSKQSFSYTDPATSPLQAFRSGYREGVKMALVKGSTFDLNNIPQTNYYRLLVWLSLGADHKNGLWAIYGARSGLNDLSNGMTLSDISDYDWFNTKFNDIVSSHRDIDTNVNGVMYSNEQLVNDINVLGDKLSSILGCDIPMYDRVQSMYIKKMNDMYKPTHEEKLLYV